MNKVVFFSLLLHLTKANQVFTCGRNTQGQLGLGDQISRQLPALATASIPELDFIEIMTGSSHTVLLGSKGVAFVSGYNFYGQLGDGTQTSRNRFNSSFETGPISSLSAGVFHSIFLQSSNVFVTGKGDLGQIGDGSTVNKAIPTLVTGLGTISIVKISAGGENSFALASNGELFAWGRNTFGGVGDGTTINQLTPTKVQNLPNNTFITDVISGEFHTLCRTSGNVLLAWGRNNLGQLCNTTSDDLSLIPVVVGQNVTVFGAGNSHTVFAVGSGVVYGCGYNNQGQLCDNSTTTHYSPIILEDFNNRQISAIGCGPSHTLIATTTGLTYGCGDNSCGQLCLGEGSGTSSRTPTEITNVRGVPISTISSQNCHTAFLTKLEPPTTLTYLSVVIDIDGMNSANISRRTERIFRESVAETVGVDVNHVIFEEARDEGMVTEVAVGAVTAYEFSKVSVVLFVREDDNSNSTQVSYVLEDLVVNLDTQSSNETLMVQSLLETKLSAIQVLPNITFFSVTGTIIYYSPSMTPTTTPSVSPSPPCANPEIGLPRCASFGISALFALSVAFVVSLVFY